MVKQVDIYLGSQLLQTDNRPISRACLHQAPTSTSDTLLIENNRVTSKRVTTDFGATLLVSIERHRSVDSTATLTLGVNGPLLAVTQAVVFLGDILFVWFCSTALSQLPCSPAAFLPGIPVPVGFYPNSRVDQKDFLPGIPLPAGIYHPNPPPPPWCFTSSFLTRNSCS